MKEITDVFHSILFMVNILEKKKIIIFEFGKVEKKKKGHFITTESFLKVFL